MKVSILRENIARGLNIVGRMIRQRATLPVLSNIMLATDKGRLKLVSTDLESAITCWIGAKIDEEGAITIPARTIIDYLASSTDESIRLDARGADIHIISTHHQATIKGIEAEEFPVIPEVKGGVALKLKSSEIKRAILSTSIAAALDETRPVLAGIYFKGRANTLYIVATDSYRLSEYKIEVGKSQKTLDVIIPSRTALELARVLPDDDSEVAFSVGENQAEFRIKDVNFLSRQIEGAFPDYEQIIPKEFVYRFESSKQELSEAIKSASVFARDAGNSLKLDASSGQVVVSAAAAQVGDAKAKLAVESSGSSLTVAFNAKYIMDAVTAIEAETISFELSGALSPGLIYSKANPQYRYVIMPLRSE
ncbi:MAG: DNA polymerase III subunit beta [Candidatus Berkelbacteria bacterium]|nr:DNA polymerase III subunit beta [Candidatus Berkelbacteria bacterium]